MTVTYLPEEPKSYHCVGQYDSLRGMARQEA